jgi:hypothetical protein
MRQFMNDSLVHQSEGIDTSVQELDRERHNHSAQTCVERLIHAHQMSDFETSCLPQISWTNLDRVMFTINTYCDHQSSRFDVVALSKARV